MTNHIAGTQVLLPNDRIGIEDIVKNSPMESLEIFGSSEKALKFAKDVLNVTDVCSSQMTYSHLTEAALELFFESNQINKETIDLLVLTHEPSDRVDDNFGQGLLKQFSLVNAKVLLISGNQCANIDVAIEVASKIAKENCLIVGAMKSSSQFDRFIGGFGVIGDAAGVIWLSNANQGLELIYSHTSSNSNLSNGQNGEGAVIENYKLYTGALNKLKAEFDFEQISAIGIQNANPMLAKQILAQYGVPASKLMLENFGEHGHLGAVDSIVNLNKMAELVQSEGLMMTITTSWFGVITLNIYRKK